METKQKTVTEVEAIALIDNVLAGLEDDKSRDRVLSWATSKYASGRLHESKLSFANSRASGDQPALADSKDESGAPYSPRVIAWIKKHKMSHELIDGAFHIDGDNSALIVKKVPGDSKSERLRNVAALLGAFSLVRSEQAKFTAAEFREALKQFDAYDASNNTTYVKKHKDVIQGDASSGYTVTTVGLDLAATLLKSGSE